MQTVSSQTPTPDVDPVLLDAVVLALARRHVTAAKRVTGVDESGRKGRVYLIDEDVVLKTHRPVRLRARRVEEFETSLEKEAFFLEQMGRESDIRTPRLLGHGREGGVEYLCITRVLGVPIRRADFSPAQRERALRDLGATLRRIHRLPQAAFAESGLFPHDGPAPALKERLARLLDQLVEAIAELPNEWQIGPPAEKIAATALAALPDTSERVALHSNPAGEHVFADPRSGALTGLIDFGDAYVGHPAFDLRPWRELADQKAVLAGYTEAGAVDESFIVTWRVALVLGELAGLLRRREPPRRAEDNLRRLWRELQEGLKP